MEDLGFAVALLLVTLWISAWSILAAIVGGVRKVSTMTSTLLGVALGPLGIMAVFALSRDSKARDDRLSTSLELRSMDLMFDGATPSIPDDVDPFA